MFALSVPWLLLILAIVALILVFRKRLLAALFLMVLCWFANCYWLVFPVNIPCRYMNNEGDQIRVMAFNINGVANEEPLKKSIGLRAMIKESNADVVFISEDFDEIYQALDSLLKVDYPFTTLTKTPADQWHYYYSKYPIVEYKRIKQNDYCYSFVYYADIKIENDTIRTFGCHMASNNYNPQNEYVRPEYVNSFAKMCEYIDDIGLAATQRKYEADSIVKYMHCGNKPTIVMGDMNDVCGSQSLNILKDAGLKDAWWNKGLGYGATIYKPVPYRLDHIFYNDKLAIEDFEIIDNNGLSDHDAVFAVFSIKHL